MGSGRMTGTIGAMPQPPKKPVHSFRVEDELWNEAVRIATERQESLSDVLRAALTRYCDAFYDHPEDSALNEQGNRREKLRAALRELGITVAPANH